MNVLTENNLNEHKQQDNLHEHKQQDAFQDPISA